MLGRDGYSGINFGGGGDIILWGRNGTLLFCECSNVFGIAIAPHAVGSFRSCLAIAVDDDSICGDG